MHDTYREDASTRNECDQKIVNVGFVPNGKDREFYVNSPYLPITFYVLHDAMNAPPVGGDVIVYALIRDQFLKYRKTEPRQFTYDKFLYGSEGFSVDYPNGADGVLILNNLGVTLAGVTVRISAIPANVRELKV